MKPKIFWITGQPGSGKTTIGKALVEALRSRGMSVVHLDGDEWRALSGNLDYSSEGRKRNVLSAQKMAAMLNDSGIFVVASFVSPIREMRENFKASHDVAEIFTHTTEIRGRENLFAENYEEPLCAFIDVDTSNTTVEASMDRLLKTLRLPNVNSFII